MNKMTIQSLIEKLEEFESRSEVVRFVQSDDVGIALTVNGLGVSYDSDITDDSEAEMSAFESAEIWSYEEFGSFVRIYDIAKAQEILNVSE